jgi:AmmeMemoRadiSam system protein A
MKSEQGRLLVQLARGAIHASLGRPLPEGARPDWLSQPGATFVTLHRGGRLRGCIGSIEPRRPLGEDVCENAIAAATRDPRFDPLTPNELSDLEVEVALLSALEPFSVSGEEDALGQLRPGVDGLVLSFGARKGTFLPQMWEQLPEPREFVRYLKQKVGLPGDFWDEEIQLQRFTAEKWGDPLPLAQA